MSPHEYERLLQLLNHPDPTLVRAHELVDRSIGHRPPEAIGWLPPVAGDGVRALLDRLPLPQRLLASVTAVEMVRHVWESWAHGRDDVELWCVRDAIGFLHRILRMHVNQRVADSETSPRASHAAVEQGFREAMKLAIDVEGDVPAHAPVRMVDDVSVYMQRQCSIAQTIARRQVRSAVDDAPSLAPGIEAFAASFTAEAASLTARALNHPDTAPSKAVSCAAFAWSHSLRRDGDMSASVRRNVLHPGAPQLKPDTLMAALARDARTLPDRVLAERNAVGIEHHFFAHWWDVCRCRMALVDGATAEWQ